MDMQDSHKKDSYFKCPNCDAELCAEKMDNEETESDEKPVKKMNAGNMPMGQLKSKITSTTPTTNPPGITSPNLNSY